MSSPQPADIAKRVREFLLENHPNPGVELTDELDLFVDWLIDSLAVVELVFFIEEELGVEVEQMDVVAENFQSIETIARYVCNSRR